MTKESSLLLNSKFHPHVLLSQSKVRCEVMIPKFSLCTFQKLHFLFQHFLSMFSVVSFLTLSFIHMSFYPNQKLGVRSWFQSLAFALFKSYIFYFNTFFPCLVLYLVVSTCPFHFHNLGSNSRSWRSPWNVVNSTLLISTWYITSIS